MRRTLFLAALILAIPLTSLTLASPRAWWSKASHRATDAALADADVQAAANSRFGADNDVVGFEVTKLGPVTGGTEYEVRLIFDAVGTVPDMGDVTAVVFVSTDLTVTYVVSSQAPDPDSAVSPGGGEINNSIEYKAASAAFSDSEVQAELDARFDANVTFTDVDVVIISTDETGTTVDVIMDSNSQESGKGDVTATVLVTSVDATVIEVTGE